MANTKRIIDYPIATNLGTSNYVVGTVDDQTMRIPTDIISSSDFVVTFNTVDGINFTANKTFSETMAAHNSGKRVIFSVPIVGLYFEPYCFIENMVIVASVAYSVPVGTPITPVGNKINAVYYGVDNSVHLVESPDLTPEPRVYDTDGLNLKDVFGTASAFHTAVAAGDFSRIRVGDYWPITLNGSYRDYGEGSTVGQYTTKSFNNATVILEVAAINPYWKYGDSGDIANGAPHVLFISRDCLPATFKMRKTGDAWEDTNVRDPWRGSALYKTLNYAGHGIADLVASTDIGAYLYASDDGNGMRYYGEYRETTSSTTSIGAWSRRGRLFLPTESEICGHLVHATDGGIMLPQIHIFAGSYRRIIKGLGNGGAATTWWTQNMRSYSSDSFCAMGSTGIIAPKNAANTAYSVPLCFLVT